MFKAPDYLNSELVHAVLGRSPVGAYNLHQICVRMLQAQLDTLALAKDC